MRITNQIRYTPFSRKRTITQPSFKHYGKIESVSNTTLGMRPNGLVGSIKVFDKNKKEVTLNIFKEIDSYGETYYAKDMLDKTVGKIVLKICKKYDHDGFFYDKDPSHVYISELKNYSNPNTPYYFRGLDEYKGVGTRLLQIALKRSYEEYCNGNIELASKNNAVNFYKKLGFIKKITSANSYIPHFFYLPDMNKDKLAGMYGELH